MNRLEEILCVKRAEVQRLLPRRKELQRLAEVEGEYRGFRSALKRRDDQIAIIAEIKKASPSSGLTLTGGGNKLPSDRGSTGPPVTVQTER